jgi:hypothetical protein
MVCCAVLLPPPAISESMNVVFLSFKKLTTSLLRITPVTKMIAPQLLCSKYRYPDTCLLSLCKIVSGAPDVLRSCSLSEPQHVLQQTMVLSNVLSALFLPTMKTQKNVCFALAFSKTGSIELWGIHSFGVPSSVQDELSSLHQLDSIS